MKNRNILLFILLIISATTFSQQIGFKRWGIDSLSGQIPVEDLLEHSINLKFGAADLNGDQVMDLVSIPEFNSPNKVYLNNGNGQFAVLNSIQNGGLIYSSHAFGDVDGDGEIDLVVSGRDNSNNYMTKIFLNSGGNLNYFGTIGYGVINGELDLVDLDNDSDLDLVLSQSQGLSNGINIFSNNGLGVFTQETTITFSSTNKLSFADVNNDSLIDILGTGSFLVLYLNNGSFNFSLDQLYSSSLLFKGVLTDVDGDSDIDILYMCASTYGVYYNDGVGNFTQAPSTLPGYFTDMNFEVGDLNNDGFPDFLISGYSSLEQIRVFINDSTGGFNELAQPELIGISEGSLTLTDIEADGDLDLITVGYQKTRMYLNDGNGVFSLNSGSDFDQLTGAFSAFGNIDNDGYLDVVYNGTNDLSGLLETKLYKHNSSLGFVNTNPSPFAGTKKGTISIGDVNGDSFDDVLVTGEKPGGNLSPLLYINNQGSSFSSIGIPSNNPFTYATNVKSLMLDIDNDSDLDIIYRGINYMGVYENNGQGLFTEKVDGLPNGQGYFVKIDFDKDGDFDLIIQNPRSTGSSTDLFTNDGQGNFSYTKSFFLPVSTISVGDVDSDGYEDLLIGNVVYFNNQNNDFAANITMPSSQGGSSILWDPDLDGDLDALVLNTLYINDGTGSFSQYPSTVGDVPGLFIEGDIDNDGDPDLFVTHDSWVGVWENLFISCESGLFPEIKPSGIALVGNAHGPVSYQWFDCMQNQFIPGETDEVFIPSANGLYAVVVSNGSCSDTSDCYAITNIGLQEVDLEKRIQVYPNPTNSTISIKSEYPLLEVTLHNVGGVEMPLIKKDDNLIDLTSFPTGIYILKVETKHGIYHQKILKQ